MPNAAHVGLLQAAQMPAAGGGVSRPPEALRGSPPVTSNKSTNSRLQNEIIVELHRAGFVDAHRPPEHKGLTVSERITRNHGDIVGTPWTLGVRAEQTLRLSKAQTAPATPSSRVGARPTSD